jgi:hypothetical protein
MSQNVRSHGRLYVVKDTGYPPDTVLFDPHAKTAFLVNIRYYGWIKSIALSLAGDILEDEHGIWSVHGACGYRWHDLYCWCTRSSKPPRPCGAADPAPHPDDIGRLFFLTVYNEDILAYGSEKNFTSRRDCDNLEGVL